MPVGEPCPGVDHLRALYRGELGGGLLDAVCRHLWACAGCEARLAAIEDADAVLANLRQFLDRPPPVADGEYRRLESRAKAIPFALGLEPAGAAPDRRELPPDPGAPPARLGGYRLIEELGRSGIYTVFAAVHAARNTWAAAKVVLPEYADHPRLMARFRREARAVGVLAHPNIVTGIDVVEADGWHCVVTEFVDGVGVEALVRQSGSLPMRVACEIARQVADGVQYLHGKGVTGLDLDPSNLILSPEGVTKIVDLGSAAPPGSGAPSGAPGRASPAGDLSDRRSDLRHLGATLFHLLAGRPPAGAPEHGRTPGKRVAPAGTVGQRPRPTRPDVPAELDVLIQRMTSPRPGDPDLGAQQVADALGRFASGAACRAFAASARGSGQSD